MRQRSMLTVALCLSFCCSLLQAQEKKNPISNFSLETGLQSWAFSGYSFNVYYYVPKTKLSIGLGTEGGSWDSDNLMEAVFDNGDQLDEVRLPYLVRGEVRYHFKEDREGFYGSLRFGYEEWEIEREGIEEKVDNGFVTPTFGYIWHPWGEKGFLVHPYLSTIFIIGGGDGERINNMDFELNSILINPGLAIGWRF